MVVSISNLRVEMKIWRCIFYVIFYYSSNCTGQCTKEELSTLFTDDVRSLLKNRSTYFVDKTKYALKILRMADKNFLLTRPRKFGKTTFLKTLALICEGEKSREYFENTQIYEDRNYDWKQYEVAYFDFSDIGSGEMGEFEKNLKSILKSMGADVPPSTDIERQTSTLIQKLNKDTTAENIVVLVDGYDFPVTNVLYDYTLPEQVRYDISNTNRMVLKRFFNALQEEKSKLRLVLVAGVVKLAQNSIFPQEFHDISMNPEFNAIAGFTRHELHSYYDDCFEEIAKDQFVEKKEIEKEVVDYYEGYKFSHETNENVYNPYAILNCFRKKGDTRDYWYESGSLKYLHKEMQKPERLNGPVFAETKIHHTELHRTDVINGTSMHALMYQEGYYTIQKYDNSSGMYFLKVPNEGIQTSLIEDLGNKNISFKSHVPIYKRAWDFLDELSQENVEENVRNFVEVIDRHCMNELGFQAMRRTDFCEMMECILHEAGLFNIHTTARQWQTNNDAWVDLRVETYNTVMQIQVDKNQSNWDTVKQSKICREPGTSNTRRCSLFLALNFSPANQTFLPVKDYHWILYDRFAKNSTLLPEFSVSNRTRKLKKPPKLPRTNRTMNLRKGEERMNDRTNKFNRWHRSKDNSTTNSGKIHQRKRVSQTKNFRGAQQGNVNRTMKPKTDNRRMNSGKTQQKKEVSRATNFKEAQKGNINRTMKHKTDNRRMNYGKTQQRKKVGQATNFRGARKGNDSPKRKSDKPK